MASKKVIHPGSLVGKSEVFIIADQKKPVSVMIDEDITISKKDMVKLKKIMNDTRNKPKKQLVEHPGEFELEDVVKSPEYVNVVYNGLKMGIMKVSSNVGFIDKVSTKQKKRRK